MNSNKKVKLIEGTFHHDEAKEILMSIFSSKINFHQRKNFSSQERYGKDDEIAVARIPVLNAEIQKLKQILSEAEAHNKKLKIDSDIFISFTND